MRIDIISLFPAMLEGPLRQSILGRACAKQLVNINLVNLRDFATDKHGTVDDTPFGGGAGMVLKPDILAAAIASVRTKTARVILLTPQGTPFRQAKAEALSGEQHLVLVCGHYEGIDERIRQSMLDDEISIGDYVLTNGALAALVVADAVIRLLPGTLGSAESASSDSFSANGWLEFPQYTRPNEFRDMTPPAVLLSGNHGRIDDWRREQALVRTLARRPDLIIDTLGE
jgi:tRNA (guanine37-N1)-methyltransferase